MAVRSAAPTSKKSAIISRMAMISGCSTPSGRCLLTGFTITSRCNSALINKRTASQAGNTTMHRQAAGFKKGDDFLHNSYFTSTFA